MTWASPPGGGPGGGGGTSPALASASGSCSGDEVSANVFTSGWKTLVLASDWDVAATRVSEDMALSHGVNPDGLDELDEACA